MQSKITLYVFGLSRTYVQLGQREVGVTADEEKRLLINFGSPFVTYYTDDILNFGKEWFCVDAHGRNYGTEPYGVYVKSSDAKKIILEYFATQKFKFNRGA